MRLQSAILLLWAWSVAAGAAQTESYPAAQARVDYMLNCQGCHLADGAGSPGRVPALRGDLGRYLTVAGGREYLVRVPGAANSPLDDASLAGVINWILSDLNAGSLPPGFHPYSAAEVGKLRRRPFEDAEAARRQILSRLP